MLRELPPQLFVDVHEMGRPTYCFPPNADPVDHDIGETPLDWIYNVYGGRAAGGSAALCTSRRRSAADATSRTCHPPAVTGPSRRRTDC